MFGKPELLVKWPNSSAELFRPGFAERSAEQFGSVVHYLWEKLIMNGTLLSPMTNKVLTKLKNWLTKVILKFLKKKTQRKYLKPKDFNVQIVKNLSRKNIIWRPMKGLIQEKCHMNVWHVRKDSTKNAIWMHMKESTQEKFLINVKHVREDSIISQLWFLMNEFTQEKNHLNARRATKGSAKRVVWQAM